MIGVPEAASLAAQHYDNCMFAEVVHLANITDRHTQPVVLETTT
jgi:hypothetical protein